MILLVAFSLNLNSFGEICDFFVIFLPDELRVCIHLARLKRENNVTRLLIHTAGHLLGAYITHKENTTIIGNSLSALPLSDNNTGRAYILMGFCFQCVDGFFFCCCSEM